MSEHDDPAGQASAKLGQHLALAAALAQGVAQVRSLRAAAQDRTDRQAAATARAELRARHAADRLRWSPALDPAARNQLDLPKVQTAWAAARTWQGDPEADRATRAAEGRLHQLQPEAMSHYDDAVAAGFEPAEAMRQAAWAFDPPASHADEAADRTLPDSLRSTTRTEQATLDYPRTHDIDEQVGVTAGAVTRNRAVVDGEVLASRSASNVAAENYPAARPALSSGGTVAGAAPAGADLAVSRGRSSAASPSRRL